MLVWCLFLCKCVCNIYCIIVIFILEIEGYWNNRLAQLPGGAPDTRVTYKVREFLGSCHVVMSLPKVLPLPGSHGVSRSASTDAGCGSSKSCFHESDFEDLPKPTWPSFAAWNLVEYLKYSASSKHPNTSLLGWFLTLFSATSWFRLSLILHRPEFCF